MNGLPVIKATNVTTFRNNIKKHLDQVTEEDVTLIVTRSDDKNVVVISENEYETIIKEINNLKYHLKLLNSVKEAEERDVVETSLEELLGCE